MESDLLLGAQTRALHFPLMNNLGLLQHFPSPPVPAQGWAAPPASPQHPPASSPAARAAGDIPTSRVPPRGPAQPAPSPSPSQPGLLGLRDKPPALNTRLWSWTGCKCWQMPQKESGLLQGQGWFSSLPHSPFWIWEVQLLPWWFLQKPSQSPAQSYSKILLCSSDPFSWMTSFWEKDSGMTASFAIKKHKKPQLQSGMAQIHVFTFIPTNSFKTSNPLQHLN